MQFLKKFLRIIDLTFLLRLKTSLSEDYITLIAAGVAFYFLMAAFPALAALVSLYGIFSDPHFVTEQLNLLSPFLPQEALLVLADQARSLVSSQEDVLSVSFIISIIFSIYSATRGMMALINGFNIAYNEKERRSLFYLQVMAFVLTFIMMVYALVALTLIAGFPAVMQYLHIPDYISSPVLLLRWPLLFMTALIGLEILFYFAPCRQSPRWTWLSWGSVTATVAWLGISGFFSLFVSNLGKFNEIYGSISAIIVLLLWFWLSALMILVGAEINAALAEHYRHRNPENRRQPLRRLIQFKKRLYSK